MSNIKYIASNIYRALRGSNSTVYYNDIPYNVSDRHERQRLVENLLADNYDEVRRNPDITERLTNAILYEELSDMHPDKMSRDEYPIMSEHQLARRQFGAHREKTTIPRIEVPISSLMNLATDGRDYSYPKRRQQTIEEMIYMDEVTLNRDAETCERYLDFKKGKSKGVFTVNIGTGKKTVHNAVAHDKIVPIYA